MELTDKEIRRIGRNRYLDWKGHRHQVILAINTLLGIYIPCVIVVVFNEDTANAGGWANTVAYAIFAFLLLMGYLFWREVGRDKKAGKEFLQFWKDNQYGVVGNAEQESS